ncbi:prepilin-type N-terminal cleavage/methylation domain-containing protein [Candidatus Methylomirabilis sp.]|uniref:type IV pilus modification PilV family protein n=1 Tax=Candidatus Methylomirabilis sp. TaxID=2032687 RepID=UPI002A618E9A|nr:prepilin-type N-terminal cleavage/methylation domain-containing protein [Candidatus Methylomirabilis sp.]
MSMKRYRAERQGAPKRASQGFTLIEVLIALAILTVAVLGVAATTALQSGGSAGAISFGQAAVTRGYYLSTATMLAQDRLEQVKRVQYRVGAGDPFNTDTGNPPPSFGDENPVAGYPNFNRQVRVVAGPAADTRRVTVTIAFTLPTAQGANQESINVTTLVAARP